MGDGGDQAASVRPLQPEPNEFWVTLPGAPRYCGGLGVTDPVAGPVVLALK